MSLFLTMQLELPEQPPTLNRATTLMLQKLLVDYLRERCGYPLSYVSFTVQTLKLCEEPMAVPVAAHRVAEAAQNRDAATLSHEAASAFKTFLDRHGLG